jgi:DNA mismatch endonuclease (patch repair protein)
MSKIRSRGNKTTELALVSQLRSLGVSGWRRHVSINVPGLSVRPDFIFKRGRLAVFLDGCFWHNCPLHGTLPKSNVEFWGRKLEANRARDARVNSILEINRWRVLRFWEHSIKSDPEECVAEIYATLKISDSI